MTARTSNLRLGFIGHGRHARANLYPAIALAGHTLTAVATRDTARAEAAAALHGADRGYGDHRRMLAEEDLEAVFISIDPADQVAVTIDCLEAGAHVFVEKPLGMNEDEASQVARAAERCGRQVMVGFMKRHAPAYTGLAELIRDTGRFGPVMSFTSFFAFSPWTDELRDDTGLRLAAVHIVDLVRFLFGEVREVTGYNNSRGADISMTCAVRCDSGAIGSLTFAAAPSWSREQEELTVTGRTGFARVENLTDLVSHHHAPGDAAADAWQRPQETTVVRRAANSPASGGHRDLYLRGFAGEVAHFLECVNTSRTPISSAADNVATMALCDDILRSLGRL
ncbi:Gfo/Idh/MocA family protein [Streptomyces sp. NEAU-Y11]|uniref:Gfo/Idh/MocA family protein n=1 Tax=Streptomyces cucumeris TaxID=2962890 RepID=UPI0020C838F1|nr:Gfo/Idh/MocA family oxidoreductase [Streptomyces sp. NEAU-Y11]MCP9211831.1 Gfo/Idh/MocA family oxidoreductase [Streptomyces sp. NEAU-Y11]